MKSKIIFGDEKVKNSFERLKISKTEDRKIIKWIERAFFDLEENAFCGIQISKKLIPKEYEKKFGRLDNLWKYDLPNAWRLIYTIKKGTVVVLTVILEWLDVRNVHISEHPKNHIGFLSHKNYERRFNY